MPRCPNGSRRRPAKTGVCVKNTPKKKLSATPKLKRSPKAKRSTMKKTKSK